MSFLAASGLTRIHFEVFHTVARRLDRIIIVRNVNQLCTPWIEKGYPPKPRSIKAKTSHVTGKVTATDPKEVAYARREGFYVVDKDGKARNMTGEALPKDFPFRTPDQHEEGQLIHPMLHLALVADYDLMAVVSPEAMNRNILLAYSGSRAIPDRMSPEVRRVADALNAQFDLPRATFGAYDQWTSLVDTPGCTVFFPNKLAVLLPDSDAVDALHTLVSRSPSAARRH